jgi:hypothetical protein
MVNILNVKDVRAYIIEKIKNIIHENMENESKDEDKRGVKEVENLLLTYLI